MARAPVSLSVILMLVLLPVVLLAPGLFGDSALLAVHPGQLLPWSAETEPAQLAELQQRSAPLAADKALMFRPQLELALARLRAGEWPLWNPDTLCGVPLLAQAVHGVLHPPVAAVHLLVSGPRAWAWLAALQIALAGVGMLALARSFGLAPPAALLSGLTFALCGFLAVRLEWYQIQGASLWLPFLLLAAVSITRGGGLRAVAGLGAALGASLLAGFPQASVLSLYAVAGLLAVAAWQHLRSGARRQAVRTCGLGAAGVLLGLALGAPQLLPAVELAASPDSTRRAVPPELVATLALRPTTLATAVVPDLFGHPRDLALHELPHLRQDGVLRRLYGEPNGNWVETTATIGLASLVLALLGLVQQRPGRALGAALFVGGALLAIRTPLLPWVLSLPGLDAGDPKRFLLLFSAGGALLAGLGLQRLLDEGPSVLFCTSLGVAATAMAVIAAWSLALSPAGWVEQVAGSLAASAGAGVVEVRAVAEDLALDLVLLQRALLRTAVLLIVIAGAVLLARRARAAGLGMLLLVAVFDLVAFQMREITWLPLAGATTPPPGLAELRDAQGGRLLRVHAGVAADVLAYPLPPNTGLPWGVRDVSGYITLAPRRVEALHELLAPGTATGLGVAAVTAAALDTPLAAHFAVSRVISAAPLQHRDWTLLAQHGELQIHGRAEAPRAWLATDVVLVSDEAEATAALRTRFAALTAAQRSPGSVVPEAELRRMVVLEWRHDEGPDLADLVAGPADARGLARVSDTPLAEPGSVRFLADEPEQVTLEVRAERSALLVLADTRLPGWEARVNGRPVPVLAANLAFRGVPVPAGKSTVEFRYRPPAARAGLYAGGAGLLALVVLGLLSWRSARSEPLRTG